MQPKVLSIRKAEYIPAPYFGKNESGYAPLGDRVLIRPDIASSNVGGLHIPDDIRNRAQLSGTSGVVIELGDDAFRWNFDRTRQWIGYRPKPGDRVSFGKYSGQEILGKDGQTYRMMDDKAIGGVEKAEEKS